MASYDDYIAGQAAIGRGMVPAQAPTAPPQPPSTGPNGLMGYVEAPVAGALETAGSLASAVQGGAQLVGATNVAAGAKAFADQMRAKAAGFQSPELEQGQWYDPRTWAYQALKAAPAAGGMLVAGVATGGAADLGLLGGAAARMAPETIGGIAAGVSGYPLAVGQDVQNYENTPGNGPLTRGEAMKAALWAVPQAAAAAIPFHTAAGAMANIATGDLKKAVVHQATAAAIGGAAQDLVAQQTADPNRDMASRMREMVESALTGGVMGGVTGGAIEGVKSLAKVPLAAVGDKPMAAAVDQALNGPPPPMAPESQIQPQLPIPAPVNPERPYQQVPQARLDQLTNYFGSIPNPDLMEFASKQELANEQLIRQQLNPAAMPHPALPERPPPTQIIPQPSREQADLVTRLVADQPVAERGLTPAELDVLPNVTRARPEIPVEDIARAAPPAMPEQMIPQPTAEDQALALAAAHDQPVAEHGLIDERLPGFGDKSAEGAQELSPADSLRKAAEGLPLKQPIKDMLASDDPIQALRAKFATDKNGEPLPDGLPIKGLGTGKPREALLATLQAAGIAKDDRVVAPPVLEPATPAADALAAVAAHPDTPPPVAAQAAAAADVARVPAAAKTQIAAVPPPAQKSVVATSPEIQASADALKTMNIANASDNPTVAAMKNKIWQDSLARDPSGRALYDGADGTPEAKLYTPGGVPKFSNVASKALDDHTNLATAKMFEKPAGIPTATRTPNDIGATGIIQSGGTLKNVLDFARTNGETPDERAVASLLLSKGVDAPVQFSQPNGRSAGIYNAADNSVHVMQGHDVVNTVLHEAIHAGSAAAFEAGGPAAKEFTGVYNEVKSKFPDTDSSTPEGNWLKNEHEFMAESFTNPNVREWMRTQPATDAAGAPTTLWGKFKASISNLLGFKGGTRNLLDQVMEKGNRVLDENASARAGKGVYARPATPNLRDPTTISNTAKNVVGVAERIGAKAQSHFDTLSELQQKAANHFGDMNTIGARLAQRGIDSAPEMGRIADNKENQVNTWNKHGSRPLDAAKALPATEQAKLDEVMAATARGIHGPDKPGEGANASLLKHPNKDILMADAANINRVYNSMSPEAKAVHQSLIEVGQTHLLSSRAGLFYTWMKNNYPEIAKGWENIGHEAQLDAEGHDNAAVMLQHQRARFEQQYSDATVALKAAAGNPAEADRLAPIERWIKDMDDDRDSLSGVPYFKMGRRGEFFAAGTLTASREGALYQAKVANLNSKIDALRKGAMTPAKTEKINALNDQLKDTMTKGFGPNAASVKYINDRLEALGYSERLHEGNGNNSMYIRVENADKSSEIAAMFREAQAAGHLSPDHEIASGPVSRAGMHGVGPAALSDIVETLRGAKLEFPEGTSKEEQAKLIQLRQESLDSIVSDIMDMRPQHALSVINARRENVQLASPDMIQSMVEDVPRKAKALSTIHNTYEEGVQYATMRKQVEALQRSPIHDKVKVQVKNMYDELMAHRNSSTLAQPSILARAFTRLGVPMEIGLSVPYMARLAGQSLTLNIPRLGSVHGFVASIKELAKQTVPALRLQAAIFKHGGTERLSGGFRLDTLLKAGINEKTARLVVEADNRGLLMNNTFSHRMNPGEDEPGFMGKLEHAAYVTSVLQRSSELFPRLQMLLAADKLYRPEVDGDYWEHAARMININQRWGRSSSPMALGTGGMFGPMGPLMNMFMSYRVKMTGELLRQVHDIVGAPRPGELPEQTSQRRMEAGKFMAAHLAAVTVISGAMGLPTVAVLASVYDKLADELTGDSSHDIMASFRGFLDHVYGPQVGVAMSRGLPAAMGVDLSRDGEQTIVPGSDMVTLLTEKRRFEDAWGDWLKNMAGPAGGLASDWVLGARSISEGRYIDGAVQMAPEALRGPLEAVRDSLYGYRNAAGTSYGISPSGAATALEAMGFEPTDKATIALNQRTISGLEARRQFDAQTITQNLARSLQIGDQAGYQRASEASMRYARDYPGLMPPEASLARYLQQQAQETATAQMNGGALIRSPMTAAVYRGMGMP